MSTNTPTAPQKTSAANIKIRPAPTTAESDSAALFGRLSGLLGEIAPGTNKNEQVTVLISACIVEGIVTEKKIIGVVSRFAFKPAHIAHMLKHGAGAGPASGHWRRNQDGTFSLFA